MSSWFIGKNYINLCPTLKAKNEKKYADYDNETKAKVEIFLSFIKEVLANNSEEMFCYLMKWFSNMIKGGKNDSCLYLKGEQGIGKSTMSEFLKDFVIGHDLTLETGSQPLKNKFNSILTGKLLIILEELEKLSINEWSAVSSVLKRLITSKTFQVESKGCNPFQTDNMNNYIINSNNDCIRDDDGRRYVILDISHKYKSNTQYFSQI